ncbi:MAG: 23S rRNA (guanosine(2251)-2'-O)-methyltransferase RlmB, partial [Aquificota bacterium]
ALGEMKERGLWVVGTHLECGEEPWKVDLTLPLVLVVGNEERGISRLVKETCDFLVRIPMEGKVCSLNVSAATAVLLYEVLRQRKGQPL